MKDTLTYEETLSALQRFYMDNVAYWESQGKTSEEARMEAQKEGQQATHDPFLPNGKLLNAAAQAAFIATQGR